MEPKRSTRLREHPLHPMHTAPAYPSTITRACRNLIRRTCRQPHYSPGRRLRSGSEITVWVGAASARPPKEIVHVPTGKPVMVDGKIEPGEWRDAAEVKMPSGGRLYIMRGYIKVCKPRACGGIPHRHVPKLPRNQQYRQMAAS
jgi:hypothetical protein